MKSKVAQNRSFANLYPDLLVDWDYDENSIDPNKIRAGDTMLASWICNLCDAKWKAKIQKRCTGKSLCPNCQHRVIDMDAKNRKTIEDRYKF